MDKHCAPKETVGCIGTIVNIVNIHESNEDFGVRIQNKLWYYYKEELELVVEKGTVEKLGKSIDEAIKSKDEEIEKLKIELKNKQSRIDYLEGQVSVYEKFLKWEGK